MCRLGSLLVCRESAGLGDGKQEEPALPHGDRAGMDQKLTFNDSQ